MIKRDIPASDLSSIDLFNKAREVNSAEYDEQAKKKLGTLRGGNSGCMVGENVIGTCHRKSLARFLGYDGTIDANTQSIFEQGFGNEAIWEGHMAKTGYAMRCEEQIPIEWTTTTGIKVTGRPDVVLGREVSPAIQDPSKDPIKLFVPELGLELKTIAAANSATGLYVEDKPKTDNLVQTAHYSMILGIPFILVYTWNGKVPVPHWAKKKKNYLPDPTMRELLPFKREYKLGWEDGNLYYINAKGFRTNTDITQDGIKEYYDLVADMADKKDLYIRFRSSDFKGRPGPFSMCDYCPWQEACDTGEHDFDLWLDYVRRDAK